MAPTSPSQLTLSRKEIHDQWKTALRLPPTPRRTLLKQVCLQATASDVLEPIDLSRLYLDLALTNGYLGEYFLADTAFERAVNSDRTHLALTNGYLGEYYLADTAFERALTNDRTHLAFALFGHGLARAELGLWEEARISWRDCLRCFEERGGTLKSIECYPFQEIMYKDPEINNDDGYATTRNIGLHHIWYLEHSRVHYNWNMASLHTRKGSRYLGIQPLSPYEKTPGLNGIPAGLRFGPYIESTPKEEKEEKRVCAPPDDIEKPLLLKSSPQNSDPSPTMKSLPPPPPLRLKKRTFPPLEDIEKPTPSRPSPQSPDPSPTMKSLPPPPPSRSKKPKASVRPRGSKVWFSAAAEEEETEQFPMQQSPTQVDSAFQPSPAPLYDSPSPLDHYSISSLDQQPLVSPTSLPLSSILSPSTDDFPLDNGRRISPRTDSSITEATTLYPHPLSTNFTDCHIRKDEDEDSNSPSPSPRPNYHIVSDTLSAIDSTTRDLDEAISLWGTGLLAQESPQSPLQSPTTSQTPASPMSSSSTSSSSSPSPRYFIFSNIDTSPILTPRHHPAHDRSSPRYIEPTINTTTNDNDLTLELLQPKTFEGFAPKQ